MIAVPAIWAFSALSFVLIAVILYMTLFLCLIWIVFAIAAFFLRKVVKFILPFYD